MPQPRHPLGAERVAVRGRSAPRRAAPAGPAGFQRGCEAGLGIRAGGRGKSAPRAFRLAQRSQSAPARLGIRGQGALPQDVGARE
eukprot:10051358-Alexandrium_andersonii.AAC.1